MASPHRLIMDLLRIMTLEEVGEITTKHNGGKFLSLTDLINERVHKNIYRDFSRPIESLDESHTAKILPFDIESVRAELLSDEKGEEVHNELDEKLESESSLELDSERLKKSLSEMAKKMALANQTKAEQREHKENENMSTFILIEKERLKKSQKSLKQKEILDLYQKNSNLDVEMIKGQDANITETRESGVLVNKKHY